MITRKINVPVRITKNLLYNQNRKHQRELKGIASQPNFDRDEQLIDQPGYNPDTQLYGAFEPADFQLGEATLESAQQALGVVESLISEFPFATEADRSAALSAFLTAVVRPCLEQAPAYNITASVFGSGKSLLASLTSTFASPQDPYVATYPSKSEEAAKLVVALCLEQPSVAQFDDMQHDWKSHGPMNRLLTSSIVTERLLGTNRTATAPTRILILGTGNNIEPERDMRRRVVTVRLTPKEQTAALRKFEFEPLEHLRKHRQVYVGLALTIIRAYLTVGKLDQEPVPIGSYKQWSRFCREPLIWLGLPDPATSLINQVSNDVDAEALKDLIDELWERYGKRSVTVRTIVNDAELDDDLKSALMALPIMEGRYVNANKLGWYLRKNRGRIVDGFYIDTGDSTERRSWRVVPPG